MKVHLAVIFDPDEIQRILSHLVKIGQVVGGRGCYGVGNRNLCANTPRPGRAISRLTESFVGNGMQIAKNRCLFGQYHFFC